MVLQLTTFPSLCIANSNKQRLTSQLTALHVNKREANSVIFLSLLQEIQKRHFADTERRRRIIAINVVEDTKSPQR